MYTYFATLVEEHGQGAWQVHQEQSDHRCSKGAAHSALPQLPSCCQQYRMAPCWSKAKLRLSMSNTLLAKQDSTLYRAVHPLYVTRHCTLLLAMKRTYHCTKSAELWYPFSSWRDGSTGVWKYAQVTGMQLYGQSERAPTNFETCTKTAV